MRQLLSIGVFIHIVGIRLIVGGSIGGLVWETHISELTMLARVYLPGVFEF